MIIFQVLYFSWVVELGTMKGLVPMVDGGLVSTQKGSLSWIEIPLECEEDNGKNLRFIFCEVQDAKSGEMRRW
jgi:hypothetical protein